MVNEGRESKGKKRKGGIIFKKLFVKFFKLRDFCLFNHQSMEEKKDEKNNSNGSNDVFSGNSNRMRHFRRF